MISSKMHPGRGRLPALFCFADALSLLFVQPLNGYQRLQAERT